jgi:type II secretory pathway component PulF
MSTFAYTAVARDGKRTNGTLAADSRAAAIAQVVEKGLHPVSVNEQGNGNGAANGKSAGRALRFFAPRAVGDATAAAPASVGGRVSQRAVESFTRELANLLAGGVPLARSLSLLRREASSAAASRLWAEVHDDVVSGNSLADTLAKHPRVFSGVYVAMVRAGEAGGFLDVVLSQIADFRTREADLKGKVKAALVYPVILAVMATVVVIFLMTYFIPKFSGIFAEFGAGLPALTKFIVGVSHGVRDYGLIAAVALVLVVIAIRRAISTDTGRRRVEQTVLSVPVLGRVIARFALVRFCRMLGTLVGAGVPLVASLRTAREAIGNQTLADTVLHAIEEVQRGQALSKSLASSPKLFPASVIETIAVAEETGRLDKELVRLAGSYEGDLERQLRMLVAVAEPLLLFMMASVIGTVVVGMLLPVFNLQDLIK